MKISEVVKDDRNLRNACLKTNAEITALIPNVDPLTGKKAIPGLVLPWRYFRDCGGYSEH